MTRWGALHPLLHLQSSQDSAGLRVSPSHVEKCIELCLLSEILKDPVDSGTSGMASRLGPGMMLGT
jgi:hypothetical protein